MAARCLFKLSKLIAYMLCQLQQFSFDIYRPLCADPRYAVGGGCRPALPCVAEVSCPAFCERGQDVVATSVCSVGRAGCDRHTESMTLFPCTHATKSRS